MGSFVQDPSGGWRDGEQLSLVTRTDHARWIHLLDLLTQACTVHMFYIMPV